jgi:hypothetical protein
MIVAILHQEQSYFTEYHKMTKPQIKIVDCETGEEIVRDATAQEIALIKLNADNALAEKAEAEAKVIQRQTILDRLGLTADEAKLLLG